MSKWWLLMKMNQQPDQDQPATEKSPTEAVDTSSLTTSWSTFHMVSGPTRTRPTTTSDINRSLHRAHQQMFIVDLRIDGSCYLASANHPASFHNEKVRVVRSKTLMHHRPFDESPKMISYLSRSDGHDLFDHWIWTINHRSLIRYELGPSKNESLPLIERSTVLTMSEKVNPT